MRDREMCGRVMCDAGGRSRADAGRRLPGVQSTIGPIYEGPTHNGAGGDGADPWHETEVPSSPQAAHVTAYPGPHPVGVFALAALRGSGRGAEADAALIY